MRQIFFIKEWSRCDWKIASLPLQAQYFIYYIWGKNNNIIISDSYENRRQLKENSMLSNNQRKMTITRKYLYKQELDLNSIT